MTLKLDVMVLCEFQKELKH